MALVLQLRARDLAGLLNDGDPVSSWPNAQGVTVSQATAGLRPIFHAAEVNGWDAVQFDAVDDRMSTNLVVAAPFTLIAVYRTDFTGSAARRIVQGTNNWLIGPYAGTVNHHSSGFASLFNHVAGGLYIHTIRNTAAAATARGFDGSVFQEVAAGHTVVPGTLGLGAQGAFAEPAQSTLLELRVYNTALSDGERDFVEYALMEYYNAPPVPSTTFFEYFLSELFDIAAAIALGPFEVSPSGEVVAEDEGNQISWTEPAITDGDTPVGEIFEYHVEIDRSEGTGFVVYQAGLGTRFFTIDLRPFIGRQIGFRVTAELAGVLVQAETWIEVVAPVTVLFNEINCPPAVDTVEILEGSDVAFSDVDCPDTTVLTSEDEC